MTTPHRPLSRYALPSAAALLLCAGMAVAATDVSLGFGQEGTVKVRVPISQAGAVLKAGGGSTVAVYESFVLAEVAAAAAPAWTNLGGEVFTQENFVLLNTGSIDTTNPAAKALQRQVGQFEGKAMHLVQFAGPIQPQWYADLENTGVEVVTYIPSNAYLVYGDAAQLANLEKMAALSPQVQWHAPYTAAYRIDPALLEQMQNAPAANQGLMVIAQLVHDDVANAKTMDMVNQVKTGPLLDDGVALNYRNFTGPLTPAAIEALAMRPDVVSIQAYGYPSLMDERQNQILAGNITSSFPIEPTGPGYLAWITGKGFNQAQFTQSAFAVDVSDSGIDNATTSPNHFGLYVNGVRPGISRVIYNRLEGSANGGSTLQGCDGHGTINSHIIAGFNNLAAAPHIDASGYHYGLGVCPWVKVGSSVIFDPSSFTNPDFEDLQSRAYRDGSRISSNSWGNTTGNAYNTYSQRYDALVRDAQPTGSAVPAAGNQAMVIVFANGNSGTSSTATHAPQNAKNLISVGATENVHPFGGADGCGMTDGNADSADDLAPFSSRGPTGDGRKKPDIVAPGTHVTGGVGQQANPGVNGLGLACYSGNGVCGGVASANYFPAGGQQWYTASSGTSHSCPAVAGGAALVRQYFINEGMPAPSPAMTKAALMNSARYINGSATGGNLWSISQGMGEMQMNDMLERNSSNTLLRDELAGDVFTATGQTRVFTGTVVNITKPLRITLAWTDAPGATSGSAWKNNLDLTVTVGANTYKGNVFTGALSTTGGSADVMNNVESVLLPAGTSGNVTVTVTAANINSDGIPNNAASLDQDFALVAYNLVNVPANNACANAFPMAVGTSVAGTTANGTSDGSSDCGNSSGASDVWYTITPTCTGPVQLDTCGSSFDTVLSVHSGCPGTTANQIACNDDQTAAYCPGIRNSLLTFNAVSGTTYRVRVTGYQGDNGSFVLNSMSTSTGADTCAAAPVVGDGVYQFSNCGATTDGPTESGCSFCCGDLLVNNDLWYRYNAAASSTVTVDTCASGVAGFDTKLAVYAGACPTAPDTAIACNDDTNCGGTNRLSSLSFAAVGGQSYLIRVGGYTTNRGAGTLTIASAPACGTADFNGDGDIGTDADIEAFFACLAGNCCATCGTADFNGDGDIGTDADIEAFFRVLAGGNC